MCRMLGYLGEPRRLLWFTDEAPHSLYRQSYAAREMDGATVNADGWGTAFYLDDEREPCVYRSTLPIWGDGNRRHLGRALRSRCLLAAVRSATNPESLTYANTQPFVSGSLSFLHNGYVHGFKQRLMRPVRARLSDRTYQALHGDTDSEHLFGFVLDRWSELDGLASEERLKKATSDAVLAMKALCMETATKALFSVLVSDGEHIVAVRTAVEAKAPTLYVDDQRSEGGLLIASERLDDNPSWRACAPDAVMVLSRSRGQVDETELV